MTRVILSLAFMAYLFVAWAVIEYAPWPYPRWALYALLIVVGLAVGSWQSVLQDRQRRRRRT